MNPSWFMLVVMPFLLLSSGASAESVSTWFAPSTSKIMRDAKPGESPPQAWDLAAAKNEVESCQLVLVSHQPIKGVTVSLSFSGEDGKQGGLKPALFKVEYVPIKKEKIPYPDPLPPLTCPFDLQSGQTQPVWISIRVPKDAAPGMHRGTINVAAGSWSKQFPLNVQVWDFALPDTPACTTAFGYSPLQIADWHGLKPGSAEGLALSRKYYEFLLDHRLSPHDIPGDLMSDEAVKFLNDPRMTSFRIPHEGKSDAELKTLVQRLQNGGWFAKGYFYVVDEPVTKEAYDQFAAASERLRRIEPRYRIVAPFWSNPDFIRRTVPASFQDNGNCPQVAPGFGDKLTAAEMMVGKVNIWCPHLLYVNSEPDFRNFLKLRLNAGETLWWYVCNNPRDPYNNLLIDQSAMAHRTLLWQQKREGFQGLLYWSTTYWDRKAINDPWQNMDTLGTGYFGDGSLLYPGRKVGIDGPVGSLRLETLRNGLEDFDYLTLADRRLGPAATGDFVARITQSLTDYERNPIILEKVRRELGAALEKAIREPLKN
jgi:hypothetical protein